MAMGTLRLSCDAAAFALLREEVRRFPAAAVRLSRSLPGDGVISPPGEQAALLPCSRSSHPYPVEIDLPLWTMERDQDLRRWLYALGGGVRIEAPAALAAEHRRWLIQALAAYGPAAADAEAPAGAECRAGVAAAGVEQKRELTGPVRVVRKRLAAKSGAARVRAQRRQRC